VLLAGVLCSCRSAGRLHDVALGHATMVGVHGITPAGLKVLDVAEPQLTTTILVSLELGNGSIGRLGSIESDHTGASRAAARFVLDLGLFNFADGPEQLDQVIVARGPGKLHRVSEANRWAVAVEAVIHAWHMKLTFRT
jgi:hypothetical protein